MKCRRVSGDGLKHHIHLYIIANKSVILSIPRAFDLMAFQTGGQSEYERIFNGMSHQGPPMSFLIQFDILGMFNETFI